MCYVALVLTVSAFALTTANLSPEEIESKSALRSKFFTIDIFSQLNILLLSANYKQKQSIRLIISKELLFYNLTGRNLFLQHLAF